MYLKRNRNLSLPKDTPVNQAFRSPFRSPRPSPANNVDTENISPAGQASASRGDSQTRQGEVATGHVVTVTPSKPVPVASGHLTPRNSIGRRREPYGKLVAKQFVSPFQNPRNTLFQQQTETPEQQLANLIKEESVIDKEIALLKDSGYKVEELKGHIDDLHRYNDIKDAAQLVLGRLADIEQVTVKEMHKKYQAPLDDDK